METIQQYIDLWYLLVILMAGKLLTQNSIIKPLPNWMKSILYRIGTAWRVLLVSLLIGVAYYFVSHPPLKVLVITYMAANSMYSLLIKYFFKWAESKLSL